MEGVFDLTDTTFVVAELIGLLRVEFAIIVLLFTLTISIRLSI